MVKLVNKLILTELYKLRKNLYFKLSMVALFLFPIFMLYTNIDYYLKLSTYETIMEYIKEPQDSIVIFSIIAYGIFVSFFISEDFDKNITSLIISTGHSRIYIFLSKTIITILGVFILSLIIPFSLLITCSIINGLEKITLIMLLELFTVLTPYITLIIANTCIYILLAYLIKRVDIFIAFSTVYFIGINILIDNRGAIGGIIMNILEHNILFYLLFLGKSVQSDNFFILYIISLLIIIITLLISYIIFRRSELK